MKGKIIYQDTFKKDNKGEINVTYSASPEIALRNQAMKYRNQIGDLVAHFGDVFLTLIDEQDKPVAKGIMAFNCFAGRGNIECRAL